jgi:osmotically-inducible protein OsmY
VIEMRIDSSEGWRRYAGAAVTGLALFMVTGAAGAVASTAQTRTDTQTAARVYASLKADPVFFYRNVNVTVDDGVAHLSGYVWTADALYHAEDIARRVPGVTGVVDQMTLARSAVRGADG